MKSKQPRASVSITFKDILLTLFFLAGAVFLFLIRDIIIGVFVSIVIATALNPLVNRLERLRLPRSVAILLIYLTLITSFVALAGTILPPLIAQTLTLINSLPLDTLGGFFSGLEINLESIDFITSRLNTVTPLVGLVTATFSSIITFITFAVITFYLLIERSRLHTHLMGLYSNRQDAEAKAETFINTLESQIGNWVRGQLTLMIIVGSVTYLGLRLLNVQFALPLAILAGLLEIIPNIGPTISAIPAIATPIITGQNPAMAVFVAALYFLIQQLENNLIVPKVMQSAVGLHPLITILLIITGLKLAGIGGAILAVPLFLVSRLTFQEFVLPKLKNTSL